MPEFIETFREYAKRWVPYIKKNETIGFGLSRRFSFVRWSLGRKRRPFSRARYMIYAKTLGFAGDVISAGAPTHPVRDVCVGAFTPKELVDVFPKETVYGPGKTVHRYVYGYDSYGNRIKMYSLLASEVVGRKKSFF